MCELCVHSLTALYWKQHVMCMTTNSALKHCLPVTSMKITKSSVFIICQLLKLTKNTLFNHKFSNVIVGKWKIRMFKMKTFVLMKWLTNPYRILFDNVEIYCSALNNYSWRIIMHVFSIQFMVATWHKLEKKQQQ